MEKSKNKWINLQELSVVKTPDIGVSTALLCADFELLSVEKVNPRKAVFVFKKDTGIEDVIGRYLSDELEVNARSFYDNFKIIKNKLYAV